MKIGKKLLSVLLSVLLTLTAIPYGGFVGLGDQLFPIASAATSGDYTYNILGDGTAEITDYNGAGGDVIIPNTIDGYTVTTIGASAFQSCDALTSIVIPDSVTIIGYSAFDWCDALTSIVIPDSVTTIGNSAFYWCKNLTSVELPDSVRSIGSSAFYNTGYYNQESNWENGVLYIGNHCIEVKNYNIRNEYTIREGTITIADFAFYDCEALTTIEIPDSVTTIGDWAFRDCDALTTVEIGDSVTTIGDEAFALCDALTAITVAAENPNYSSDAYGVLYNKEKTTLIQYPIGNSRTAYTIPDSVTTIGDNAFAFCFALTSVVIGDSVTTISSYAFYDCTALTTVEIGSSVTTISSYAFYDCTALTTVNIPDSVRSIGSSAFYNTGYYNQESNWENGVLYIGNHCINANSDEIPSEYTIREGTITIGGSAFSSCEALTTVEIPDSVTTIGDNAFYNCDALTAITVAAENPNYSSDADGVLYNKDKTTLIQYPVGNSRTEYTIPDSVTTIVDYAFEYCHTLTTVEIGDSVTSIGDGAFGGCDALTSVVIPDSVTTIGYGAFHGCSALTTVYYAGTEEQWNAINIGLYNDSLINADIHFNYTDNNSESTSPPSTDDFENNIAIDTGLAGAVPDYTTTELLSAIGIPLHENCSIESTYSSTSTGISSDYLGAYSAFYEDVNQDGQTEMIAICVMQDSATVFQKLQLVSFYSQNDKIYAKAYDTDITVASIGLSLLFDIYTDNGYVYISGLYASGIEGAGSSNGERYAVYDFSTLNWKCLLKFNRGISYGNTIFIDFVNDISVSASYAEDNYEEIDAMVEDRMSVIQEDFQITEETRELLLTSDFYIKVNNRSSWDVESFYQGIKTKKSFSKNTYMADVWLNQLEDRPDGYATGESHWLMSLFDENSMNQSMAEVVFTSGQENSWFAGAVGTWEVAEYIFKPETAIVDGMYFDAKNRYMSMLFDLISYTLNNKSTQDSFVAQAKEVSASLKNALATPFTVGQQVYTMSNYTELKQAAKANQKEFSDWVKTQFSEKSKTNKFFSKFNDIGSGILEIMDVCAIADDFYTRMTAYMLAASMTESLWNALEMIGQNTDSADLQTAVNYLASVAREANLANIVAYTDIEFCADIGRFMSDKCIGELFEQVPIYGVWRKVYDAGTTVVNLMLNTQNIIDKYYLCKAASELFSASDKAVQAAKSRYLLSQSDTDAGIFISSVQLNLAVRKTDMDAAAAFIKAGEKEGIINAARQLGKSALEWLGFEQEWRYEDFCANKESITRTFNEQWEWLNVHWILDASMLAADYPEYYPYYASDEITKSQYDPVLLTARIQKDGGVRLTFGEANGYMDGGEITANIGGESNTYTYTYQDSDSTFWQNYVDINEGKTDVFPKKYALRFFTNPTGVKVYTNADEIEMTSSPLQTPTIEVCTIRDMGLYLSDFTNGLSFAIHDETIGYRDMMTYEIYRSTDGVNYRLLDTISRNQLYNGHVTVYTDTTVREGNTYSYRVRSVMALGNGITLYSEESESFGMNTGNDTSIPVFANDNRIPRLSTRALTRTAQAQSGIALSWDAAENADGYRIYRAADYSPMYEYLGDCDSTEFVDATAQAGYTYDYRVVAYSRQGEAVICGAQGGVDGVVYRQIAIGADETEMTVGDSLQINAMAYPANSPVTWSVNDPSLASITPDGVVTANAVGTVIITASLSDGITDEWSITILPNEDAPSTEPTPVEPEVMLGDVDGDGKVTSADARLALRAAVKLETLDDAKTKAADVDKNNQISTSDARKILRVAVKLDSF